jgi:hypothetical protein
MGEDEIKDAGWAVQLTAGISSFLYGIGYSHEQFKEELAKIVKHIQESA